MNEIKGTTELQTFFKNAAKTGKHAGLKAAKEIVENMIVSLTSYCGDDYIPKLVFIKEETKFLFNKCNFEFCISLEEEVTLSIQSFDEEYHGIDSNPIVTRVMLNGDVTWEMVINKLSETMEKAWKETAINLKPGNRDGEYIRANSGLVVRTAGYCGGELGYGVDDRKGNSVGSCNFYEVARLNKENKSKDEKQYWIVDKRSKSHPLLKFRVRFASIHPVEEKEVNGSTQYTFNDGHSTKTVTIAEWHPHDNSRVKSLFEVNRQEAIESNHVRFEHRIVEAYVNNVKFGNPIIKSY